MSPPTVTLASEADHERFPATRATPDDEGLVDPMQTVPADRRETAIAVSKAVRGYHPGEPHWYLAVIGTDPPFQGQGLGAALLTHTLKQCDAGGHVAYLESGNPRNLSLYERHGFEVIGEIRIGECPAIYPMVRPAR